MTLVCFQKSSLDHSNKVCIKKILSFGYIVTIFCIIHKPPTNIFNFWKYIYHILILAFLHYKQFCWQRLCKEPCSQWLNQGRFQKGSYLGQPCRRPYLPQCCRIHSQHRRVMEATFAFAEQIRGHDNGTFRSSTLFVMSVDPELANMGSFLNRRANSLHTAEVLSSNLSGPTTFIFFFFGF